MCARVYIRQGDQQDISVLLAFSIYKLVFDFHIKNSIFHFSWCKTSKVCEYFGWNEPKIIDKKHKFIWLISHKFNVQSWFFSFNLVIFEFEFTHTFCHKWFVFIGKAHFHKHYFVINSSPSSQFRNYIYISTMILC